METHKKISPPHYFFILFLLLVVQSLSYGNDTLQIDNPCPVGGVPVFEITGQIDINNPIKKIPVFTDQLCHASIDSYHYNEHWLGWSEVGKLNFSISDSTLQISIYDAALYFSNDPCSGLLLEGQGYFKFELASTLHRNYIVIVVAGMIGQEYVINSDNVLRVYNEACIFDGTAKGEILSYNKIVMPDITVTAPDVKYVWDEMFGFQCNELDRLFRNQAISIMSPFQQLTIQSEYLFRKTKVETITWPKDVVLEDYTDCHNFTATPIEIYTQLKLKLGDSLARAMSFPFVNGSAIFGYDMSDYTFAYRDFILKECNGQFITEIRREWTYKNKCNNTVNTYIQQISLKYEKPELIQLKDIRLSTDPWGCVATLRLDNNLAKVACEMDYTLTMLPYGFDVTCTGNATDGFTCNGFSAGTYKVKYFVMDCLGQRSDTLEFSVTVQPYQYLCNRILYFL
ncbi:MAG: hypothetical protein IPN86_15675 [Saprospiraceae bacterium]|nr:hypothetical protein [Saprospiraceae bacterium]